MSQAGEVLSPSILLLFIPQTRKESYELFNDCVEVITALRTWGFNGSDGQFGSVFDFLAWQQHASVIFQFIYFVLGKKLSVLRSRSGWDGTINRLWIYQVLIVSWWQFYTLVIIIIVRNRRLFFMFIIISQNIMPLYFFNNVCNNTFIFSTIQYRRWATHLVWQQFS